MFSHLEKRKQKTEHFIQYFFFLFHCFWWDPDGMCQSKKTKGTKMAGEKQRSTDFYGSLCFIYFCCCGFSSALCSVLCISFCFTVRLQCGFFFISNEKINSTLLHCCTKHESVFVHHQNKRRKKSSNKCVNYVLLQNNLVAMKKTISAI